MEQRVSLVTLGVTDFARSRAFYEALGWTSHASNSDDVVSFQAGGLVVARNPFWEIGADGSIRLPEA